MPLQGVTSEKVGREYEVFEDVGGPQQWIQSNPCYEVGMVDRALYVHQGEIAIVANGDDFDVVGSDDATTCFIVLAKYHGHNGAMIVTHIDTEQRASGIGYFLDRLAEGKDDCGVDVYISGGLAYMKDSANVLIAIIESIRSTRMTICNLKLLNFQSNCNNSDDGESIRKPNVTGCGFRIKGDDRVVVPMKFPIQTRGPAGYLRQAMMLFSDHLSVVVAPENGSAVCIHPNVEQLAVSGPTRAHLQDSLRLSDGEFILRWSTSPHCEPDHFVSELKGVVSFLLGLDKRGLAELKDGIRYLLTTTDSGQRAWGKCEK